MHMWTRFTRTETENHLLVCACWADFGDWTPLDGWTYTANGMAHAGACQDDGLFGDVWNARSSCSAHAWVVVDHLALNLRHVFHCVVPVATHMSDWFNTWHSTAMHTLELKHFPAHFKSAERTDAHTGTTWQLVTHFTSDYTCSFVDPWLTD